MMALRYDVCSIDLVVHSVTLETRAPTGSRIGRMPPSPAAW